MLRVDKRKRIASTRAMERAAKLQCKKDELQTEALLNKARYWSAHMFDSKCVDSVTCKAALVEECLRDVQAVAKSTQHWRETALARVPAKGHSRVGAPRGTPKAVGGALHQGWRVHGGAGGRAREQDLDGR
jgi:hypothetical protein